MSKTARLYKIESMIRSRGHVSFQSMLDELEVSRATLKRDLEYLRSRLGAPIEYDAMLGGYRFGQPFRGQSHELPGLWFNERELYSLLMAHQLLSEIDSDGILSRHLQPLLDRIHHLLGSGDGGTAQALMQRVRIVSAMRRPVPSEFFERVAEAVLQRKRLALRYLTRGRGEVGDREVSPQRLVHYRNTWYLDAWCHRVEGLRRFALDAMQQATVLETSARELPLADVAEAMDAGYGIYAGGQRQWAELVFDPQAAPWISQEQWHPEQQGRWLPGGSYELKLPYVDDTELVMDILRQAEQVRVVAPDSLRDKVLARHRAALGAAQAQAATD